MFNKKHKVCFSNTFIWKRGKLERVYKVSPCHILSFIFHVWSVGKKTKLWKLFSNCPNDSCWYWSNSSKTATRFSTLIRSSYFCVSFSVFPVIWVFLFNISLQQGNSCLSIHLSVYLVYLSISNMYNIHVGDIKGIVDKCVYICHVCMIWYIRLQGIISYVVGRDIEAGSEGKNSDSKNERKEKSIHPTT